MKCALIIDQHLPLGLIANTAAVLAMSIGNQFSHLIGADVPDQDGMEHAGITQIPIPVLKGDPELIATIRQKVLSKETRSIYMVDFCDLAQQSKQYDEYREKLLATPTKQLVYLGLGLYGPLKEINKIIGNIPLLR